MHTATGCGGVDRGDHRLLAVEHGTDQALPSVADEAGRIPHGESGGAGRPGRAGLLGSEVRTRAESLLTGSGENHDPDGEVGGRLLEPHDDLIAHGRRDGVAGLGPVEGDGGHPLVQPVQDRIRRGNRLVGHQMRWMMFIREVQTGSPVFCSRHAVSTTTKVMVLPLDSFR